MPTQNKSITITNRYNQKLYGILSYPSLRSEYRNPKGFIVFCQAGLALKSGVGNQFKLMCDKLAENNYVLRFDQSGTGDSQGFLADDIPINDYFLKVMKGECVEDTIDVVKWVKEQHPDKKIILMGQCGGCLTAAYTVSKCMNNIHAIIMIAPPVLFLQESNTQKKGVRSFDAVQILKMYFKKTISVKSYKNLISGKSDIRLFYYSVISVLKSRIKTITFLKRNRLVSKHHERFNLQFWASFQNAVKYRNPMLFILPELDNETYDFNMNFKPLISDAVLSELVTIKYLPKTDHSVMFEQGRLLLDNILKKWLENLK